MTERFYRREELVGKEVYDVKAAHVGTVRDVAYSTGGRTALVVSKEKREETIPFQDISEIGDMILLKKPFMETKAAEVESKGPKMTPATLSVAAHPRENLLQLYRAKYAHSPEGVLEFHIGKLVREGMTEEQAVAELTRSMLGEPLAEPKATEPMLRESRLESKMTAGASIQTGVPSMPAPKTCPKCQRENKPAAKFCVKCGYKFL